MVGWLPIYEDIDIEIWIGSNGGNVVTNEKYEKKENIKDIEI